MLLVFFIYNFICSVESNLTNRVVGGYYVNDNSFPYASFLDIQCMDDGPGVSRCWRCSASIVNQNVLITAAHCVEIETCESLAIAVSVGHVDRKKGAVTTAYSYIVHEDYTADLINDIALIKLRTSLDFNESISRVSLFQNPPYDKIAIVAGWGQIHPTKHHMTDLLKYTYYFVLGDTTCTELLSDLSAGTICAATDGTGFISHGDSGSALVVKGYIQIGITSYMKPGITNTVAVFTDIGFFYNWITRNVERILCED